MRDRIRGVYRTLKARCNNPNSKDYKNYGGRGIKVEESFNSFDKFFTFMIKNGYTHDCKLQVDRKDNDGNYSVDNCRLVTRAENNRNMSRNVITWEIVDKVREGEYKDISNKEIGEIIQCGSGTILDIRNFKTWNR